MRPSVSSHPKLDSRLPARTVAQAFPLGLLWGWLPCGLVYSALATALGAGSLLGALGLAFFARGPRPDLALDTAVLLGGSEIALAIAAEFGAPIPLAVLLLPLMGFGMATTSAMANTVVQTESPEAMRGRVMSVYMTVFAGLSPVGSFLAGALADWFGTPVSIGLCGIVTVVSAVAISFRFGVQTSARRATVRVRGIAP